MAATCRHGYPADTCPICATLTPARRSAPVGAAAASEPAHRHRRAQALLVVLGVIAVLGLAGAVVGAAFSVLHLVELLAAIVVAGWVGYRIGKFQGRREA